MGYLCPTNESVFSGCPWIGRSFAGQTAWWEGLVAAGIALVLAVILHALASGAYVRSVLSGGGRGGKTVKMSKRAQKVGAVASSKGSAKSDSDADDTDDADSDDDAESTDEKKPTAASAKKSDAKAKAKDEEDAKSADDSRDDK